MNRNLHIPHHLRSSFTIITLLFCAIGLAQANYNILPQAIKRNNVIYDLETKNPRAGRIWALDWSPNDKYVAIGNKTGLVKIYDANTLKLHQILSGLESSINSVHFSPDSKKLAASASNGLIAIWNLDTLESTIISEHSSQVRNVRWSPSGNLLASTSHDGYINIWNTDYELIKKLNVQNGGCVGIDWLDDNTIGASCWDNNVRVFNLKTDSSLIFANGIFGTKAVLSIDWHPSGQSIATGDYGNSNDPEHTVKIWSSKGLLLSKNTSHQLELRSLAWNADGNLLATGGETIRLWNKNGNPLLVFDTNKSPVWSLDWNAEGNQIVSGHNDGTIKFWNTDGELIKQIDASSSEIISKAFNKDKSILILGFAHGEIRLIDLESMTSKSYNYHKRGITNISWSHSEEHIAFSSNDGKASIWSLKNRELRHSTNLEGHEHNLNIIKWSLDDSKVATAGYEKMIHIWNTKGTLESQKETAFDQIFDMVWDEDGIKVTQTEEQTKEIYPIEILIKRKKRILVPLHNNDFAIFNKKGKLIKGNSNEFVLLNRKNSKISNYQN